MSSYFKLFKTPGKAACEKCINDSGTALSNRTWRDVKYQVYNQINKLKKGVKATQWLGHMGKRK